MKEDIIEQHLDFDRYILQHTLRTGSMRPACCVPKPVILLYHMQGLPPREPRLFRSAAVDGPTTHLLCAIQSTSEALAAIKSSAMQL